LRTYEAMFLLDDAKCNEDFDAVVDQLKELLTRNAAEVKSIEKWDQRRMMYPINRRHRATYVLCHFDAEPGSIDPIQAACRLAPVVMRVLILVDQDALDQEMAAKMEAAISSAPADKPAEQKPEAVEPNVETSSQEESVSETPAEEDGAEIEPDQNASKLETAEDTE